MGRTLDRNHVPGRHAKPSVDGPTGRTAQVLRTPIRQEVGPAARESAEHPRRAGRGGGPLGAVDGDGPAGSPTGSAAGAAAPSPAPRAWTQQPPERTRPTPVGSPAEPAREKPTPRWARAVDVTAVAAGPLGMPARRCQDPKDQFEERAHR